MDSKEFSKRALALPAGDAAAFESLAWEAFCYQYRENSVYRQYIEALGIPLPSPSVDRWERIPFLPIEFFKTRPVVSGVFEPEEVFLSSGTSGMVQSRHYVRHAGIYRDSYTACWKYHYGDLAGTAVLALLPSYLEREGSSLIAMARGFIEQSGHPESGFYLRQHEELYEKLLRLSREGQKILLLGVSFALLDFVERYSLRLPADAIVMETGGMKGRREEMTRPELHRRLGEGFGVSRIHSEYSMTELLSQAYSPGEGLYSAPPWMRIALRELDDPLTLADPGRNNRGAINVIDLANIDSCCFIATQDMGAIHSDGRFEVLGRMDGAETRGCNLLMVE